MRIVTLTLAWISPAVIAGALGWTGIWGGSSALTDYLIPIPVAGGALHVPSFLVLIFLLLTVRHSAALLKYLAVFAWALAAAALAAMIDFDRLNGWLFTDYAPHGSPLRLDGNPFLLFVASDAFWAGIYAIAVGKRPAPIGWLLISVAPLAVIAVSALTYRTGGPVFELGGALPGAFRGEQTRYVYTPAPYNEAVFLQWLTESSVSMPWNNPNVEHEAVVFTSSLQQLKWMGLKEAGGAAEHTTATVCLFEEDRAIEPHPGVHDCFAERPTFEQSLAELQNSSATGLGKKVDAWFALARLCEGVDHSEPQSQNLMRESRCAGLSRLYARTLKQLQAQYGEDSAQVTFVRNEGESRGL